MSLTVAGTGGQSLSEAKRHPIAGPIPVAVPEPLSRSGGEAEVCREYPCTTHLAELGTLLLGVPMGLCGLRTPTPCDSAL